jgi:hypothetical protein
MQTPFCHAASLQNPSLCSRSFYTEYMITGVSYLSMKAMMKGYAIKMNYSVAKGLTKSYRSTYSMIDLEKTTVLNTVSTAKRMSAQARVRD